MARKVRLSPLQRELLWLLEEAGSETIKTVLITLKPQPGKSINQGIKGLVSLGYIEQSGDELILTQSGRKALTT